MKKKKYFPNRWQQFSEIPIEKFEPLDYELLMEMKEFWELKRSHSCVIREVTRTNRIKEHAYQRVSAAKKKVMQLLAEDREFTVLTNDSINHISPEHLFQ